MSSNTSENTDNAKNNTNSNASNLSSNEGSKIVSSDDNSLNSNQVTDAPSTSPDQQAVQQATELPESAQEPSQPRSDSIPTPSPTPGTQPIAPLASTSEPPMATPSSPPASQDSTLPPSANEPSVQREPTEATSGTAQSTDHPSQRAYWCHQCRAEITPMMVPDPMCPNCHSEFVEEIDPENDPRTFVDSAPPHQARDGAGGEQSSGGHEPVNLEDLFRLFQAAFATPQRVAMHQQRRPGQMHTSGAHYTFTSNPGGTTFTSHSFNPTTGAQASQRQDQGQTQSQGWRSPPSFLAGLLNQFGIEVHYTTDPSALASFGGFGGMGGGFNMAGNPGDYVFGQHGIDNIISQMMELQK
ncbi:hypothetical protein BGZ93_006668 [Podila epicladia]|nr:hypothetical protein BGZ93_006668 [Podila epicladia]